MNRSALRQTAAHLGGDRFLVLRNLIFSGALQASTYVLGFVSVPYLTRTLGPTDYGALAFTISLNVYGWMLVDWGFSNGGTREVAANRADRNKLQAIFWSVMSAKLLLAFAAALGLTIFSIANRSPPPDITLLPVLINVAGALLSVDWFVQGFEKMGWYAATTIGGRTVSVVLLFILVHRPEDVWIAAALQAASGLIGAAGGLIVARRILPLGRPTFDLRIAFNKIRDNRHYFLIGSNAMLYASAAPIALNLVAGTAAVGFFAAADKIMRVAASVMSPAGTVLYPRTVTLLDTDPRGAARIAGRSFLLQMAVALALASAMFFGADVLTRDLMGERMAPAADVLRWLSPNPLIGVFIRVLTTQLLFPLGRARETSRAVYATTPLYLAALIGFGWTCGPVGAAIAFTLTEAAQALLFLSLAWRKERTYLLDACAGLNPLARAQP